jgi:hypothetical protein
MTLGQCFRHLLALHLRLPRHWQQGQQRHYQQRQHPRRRLTHYRAPHPPRPPPRRHNEYASAAAAEDALQSTARYQTDSTPSPRRRGAKRTCVQEIRNETTRRLILGLGRILDGLSEEVRRHGVAVLRSAQAHVDHAAEAAREASRHTQHRKWDEGRFA